MQTLHEPTNKLNLLCNQASYEFCKALLAAVELKANSKVVVAPKDNCEASIEKKSLDQQNNPEDTKLDGEKYNINRDQSAISNEILGKQKTTDENAQMNELFESLAAIRNNLESKQRSQSRLGELLAKPSVVHKPVNLLGLPSAATSSNPNHPYSSLFSQKMGPKAFPTLSKLDSRPNNRTVAVFEPSFVKSDMPMKMNEEKKIEAIHEEIVDIKMNQNDPVTLKDSNNEIQSSSQNQILPSASTLNNDKSEEEREKKISDEESSVALASPDPLTDSVVFRNEEVDEISMELDTPPVFESSEADTEQKEEIPLENMYRGVENSFLQKSKGHDMSKSGLLVSSSKVPPSSFLMQSSKDPHPRSKPIIHALKVAEIAAKKEKEEKEKRLREKEARKIAMNKKKELGGGHYLHGPIKRPNPSSAEDGPKKKIASSSILIKNGASNMSSNMPTSSKQKTSVMDKKFKAPLLSHSSVSNQKPALLPPMPTTTPLVKSLNVSTLESSIVDTNTGEIIGLNQDRASSEYESSPADKNHNLKPPIPIWAQSPQLREALRNQKEINPDDIFSAMDAPNLKEILGNVGKVSLGVFEMMDELSANEQEEYRKAMGFTRSLK